MPSTRNIVSVLMAAGAATALPHFNVFAGQPHLGYFVMEVDDLDGRAMVPIKAVGGKFMVCAW